MRFSFAPEKGNDENCVILRHLVRAYTKHIYTQFKISIDSLTLHLLHAMF